MSFTATIAEHLAAWWDKHWVELTPAGRLMLSLGIIGQSLFVVRWFIQLAASEKEKRSVVPALFWYFSFAGTLLVLSYAIYIADPVLLLGQFGIIIYARNLWLIATQARHHAAEGEAAATPAEGTR